LAIRDAFFIKILKDINRQMKRIVQLLVPPVFFLIVNKLKNKKNKEELINEKIRSRLKFNAEGKQDTEIYWDEDFVKALDTWGADNTWLEIQLLLANCTGKVLDIACGSGPVMEICKDFKNIEIYGCDISDKLLDRAHEMRNIPKERLLVTDATKMNYSNDEFNYSYSIGSLEHFTEKGIDEFVAEAYRVTRIGSFHLVPTNEKGMNEGWISPLQSYYNNSVDWWLNHFKTKYETVIVVKSKWQDPGRSTGHWFLCYKNLPS
jgi:ubiquinone/menaquinone biosynthesis C-methylase UbiE